MIWFLFLTSFDLNKYLYPARVPLQSGTLELDYGHVMYWEECGNPNGIPVLFLHGGPGAGYAPIHRQFFDPQAYRIILFDQRGAGRSTPAGGTEHNRLENLVADIERLRNHRGVDKWLLFGGSWGSCLSLAYGISYPQRVSGLILRGVFTMRRCEIDWFLYGLRRIFPQTWEDFAAFIPKHEQHCLLESYSNLLSDPDPAIHLPAAEAWWQYENFCSELIQPKFAKRFAKDDLTALQLARIEAHYFRNCLMEPDDYILTECVRLREHPVHIIQGQYDMICPPETAYDVAKRLEAQRLLFVPNGSHSAFEPQMAKELVASTDAFREILAGS